jgi:hypothetical protein
MIFDFPRQLPMRVIGEPASLSAPLRDRGVVLGLARRSSFHVIDLNS